MSPPSRRTGSSEEVTVHCAPGQGWLTNGFPAPGRLSAHVPRRLSRSFCSTRKKSTHCACFSSAYCKSSILSAATTVPLKLTGKVYRIQAGNPSGSRRYVPPKFGIRLPGRTVSGGHRHRRRCCRGCAVPRLALRKQFAFTLIFPGSQLVQVKWHAVAHGGHWQRVDIGKGEKSTRGATVHMRLEIRRREIPLD
jgi:hypothetical protein